MNLDNEIKNKRLAMGLTQLEFSQLLGLGDSGERTVRGWENGEHLPSKKKMSEITNLPRKAPFKKSTKKSLFTFVDLFAGIGGIRLAFQKNDGHCVFTSEWDKFAQKTYASNFGELPKGDITKVPLNEIPSHDVLLAGFPCQAFSQAGLKKGFTDTRGTMFFEIQKIVAFHQPAVVVLENVKQLKGHNNGETLKTILQILRGEHKQDIPHDVPMSSDARQALSKKLNYWVDYKILRAADFGVPQNRERIFIVAFNQDKFPEVNFHDVFSWPTPENSKTCVGDILERNSDVDPKYTISEKLLDGHIRRKKQHIEKGNGFGFSVFKNQDPYTNTLSARYYKDGSEILIDQSKIKKRPRKLTPRECARLQGFPEEFIVDAVSDVQIYKQFGNSVTVPVVEAVANSIKVTLKKIKNGQI
jgi:DNA (cytosine-5)-methyltransferase 1